MWTFRRFLRHLCSEYLYPRELRLSDTGQSHDYASASEVTLKNKVYTAGSWLQHNPIQGSFGVWAQHERRRLIITPPLSDWAHNHNALQWRHNGRDGVSNHQPHDCLLNRLFRHRSKKASKLRITGRWPVNSPHKGQWRGKCFHFMTSSWIPAIKRETYA